MRVLFKASFGRDLKRIRDKELLRKIEHVIDYAENTETLHELPGFRKLSVGKNHYRIRLGEYRIGLRVVAGEVTFVRCLHRSQIYRYFP